eukprot:CAMPEP_0116874684 /NCGR_PEP_ID=MMETSP0463-20121206/6221_1 /TAXON_ID=181622 /ORGANISM="Strombidinopsis sp, Strain SopsisLIS2011" /LENGTH=135 /DNA_ID=CAMNT_0004518725 /DNA_START=683 /DNA_END=1090 /DNA_ORIENTATION=-
MVSSKPSTSKAYIILGGVRGHEGVVMARDNLGISHVTSLSKDNWYLVQTNSDHWKIGCNHRCKAATANIEALGHDNISIDTLENDVLLQAPNLNIDSIYMTTMSAIDSESFSMHYVQGTVPFEDDWGVTTDSALL